MATKASAARLLPTITPIGNLQRQCVRSNLTSRTNNTAYDDGEEVAAGDVGELGDVDKLGDVELEDVVELGDVVELVDVDELKDVDELEQGSAWVTHAESKANCASPRFRVKVWVMFDNVSSTNISPWHLAQFATYGQCSLGYPSRRMVTLGLGSNRIP